MTGYRPLWLTLTLILMFPGGCVSASRDAVQPPALSVFVQQEQTRPPGDEHLFVRDAANRLVLVLVNDSGDYLVIRSLRVAGGLPDVERRYGARYGTTFHRPLEDEWHYNEFAQQLSDPLFAEGVIPPGGVMEVVRWAILRREQLALEVAFHRLTTGQAAESFYLAGLQGGAMTPDRVFRRYRAEDLEASLHGGTLDWRTVIIPELNRYEMVSQPLAATLTLRSPAFSREAAQRMLDAPNGKALYWRGAGSWVMRTQRGWMSVQPRGVQPLPELDPLVFLLIESHDPVPVILPLQGYIDLGATAPAIRGPGYFDPGVSRLSRTELDRVFARAREKGHVLSPLLFDTNGLGKDTYLLVGDFDPQERRELARERERLLYFPSPETAVECISSLLKDKDWPELARYYDLGGSGIDHVALRSGNFFYNDEQQLPGHPAGLDRYRHPFAPGYRFIASRPSGEPDVIEVTVAISIDQGAGPPQRGLRRFLMRSSGQGYQLLPWESEKTTPHAVLPIPSPAGLRDLSLQRQQLQGQLVTLQRQQGELSADRGPETPLRLQQVEREISDLEVRLRQMDGIIEALEARIKSGRSLSVRERPDFPSRR